MRWCSKKTKDAKKEGLGDARWPEGPPHLPHLNLNLPKETRRLLLQTPFLTFLSLSLIVKHSIKRYFSKPKNTRSWAERLAVTKAENSFIFEHQNVYLTVCFLYFVSSGTQRTDISLKTPIFAVLFSKTALEPNSCTCLKENFYKLGW